MKNQYGFTLIEILLIIAGIIILTGISLPIAQQWQNNTGIITVEQTIIRQLRRAQTLSQSMDGDSTWGVKIQSGNSTLFKGATYATRDPHYDDVFIFPSTLTHFGLKEIVFSKLMGEPSIDGTITLTGLNNQIKTITLNEKGTIAYNEQ
jgi:type II secretory pathway pseudopilin PulG